MTIKVGDKLPAGTLSEYIDVETEGCTIGPNQFKVDDLTKGKKVVIFGLPGAFTPTCSAQHVPSYVKHYDELKAKGVDDILCLSVNDAFVMGAWARDQKTGGKVRMMGDGSAAYTKALGLELDLTARAWAYAASAFRRWSRTEWSRRLTSKRRASSRCRARRPCSSSWAVKERARVQGWLSSV